MSFDYVRFNAAKNRKNNILFFSSLVVAIVAFYTLLSLGDQDVMRFLKGIESDAVARLMMLIPTVYFISLFFVFFLVYFAYRYQLDNRKKEFGLYLMLGMKRSTLFTMLMGETLWNSLISILIGLPIALFLTEGIGFTTAKLVGLGIVNHKISFSISAVLGTVVGFIGIQMIAMLFLSALLSSKEPMELLRSDSPERQVSISTKKGWIYLALGVLSLAAAYGTGVARLREFELNTVLLILVLGGGGTFLLYRGMGAFIGRAIQQKKLGYSGLSIFTGRQIQENVIYQYKSLAVSSLLLVMALTCVSYGIGIASDLGSAEVRSVDFSIVGEEQEVHRVLNRESTQSMVEVYYPMLLNYMRTSLYGNSNEVVKSVPDAHDFSWTGLRDALETLPKTDVRDDMIRVFSERSGPYLISVTSYNKLLESIGKEPIQLEENQVALYTSNRDSGDFMKILNDTLKLDAYIEVDGQRYDLLPTIYDDNVVADRKITLSNALIVSNKDYRSWVSDAESPFCWNLVIKKEIVAEKGLMQAIQMMEQEIKGTELEYESYIKGIGRNLFYTVAASYLTIYLGVLFMVIANTVIGLKYMMQQRESEGRYITLLMLGADIKDLCKSARLQIRLFFGLVLGAAICSSIFAIWSMFTSFLRVPVRASMAKIIIISGISIILFVVIEFIYIRIVENISNREIQRIKIREWG